MLRITDGSKTLQGITLVVDTALSLDESSDGFPKLGLGPGVVTSVFGRTGDVIAIATDYATTDFTLNSTKKLYLDGGTDTYISEVSANLVELFAGGVFSWFWNTNGAGLGVSGKKLWVDGGGDTYFIESSANVIQAFAAGTMALEIQAAQVSVPASFIVGSTQKLRLDGSVSGDTYITESSANRMQLVAGGTEIFASTTTSATLLQSSTSAVVRVGSGTGSSSTQIYIQSLAGQLSDLVLATGTSPRWVFRKSNTAESGSDAGSNLQLLAYDDTGTNIDQPLSITRAAGGGMTITRPLTQSGGNATLAQITTPGTSQLTVGTGSNTGTSQIGIRAPAGSTAQLFFQSGTSTRWIISKNGTAESGSDAGSAFSITAFDDTSVKIDDPITIVRAAGGTMTINRPLTQNATVVNLVQSSTTSAVVVGNGTGSGTVSVQARGAAGQQSRYDLYTGSTIRWGLGRNNDAESGADNGSSFFLNAYTDAGVFIDSPLTIVRGSGGTMTFTRPINHTNTVVSLAASTTTAIVNVGSGTGTGLSQIQIKAATGQTRQVVFLTGSTARWQLLVNTAAESGSNAGAAFSIGAFDDSGVLIDSPISIVRAAAGQMTMTRPLKIDGGGSTGPRFNLVHRTNIADGVVLEQTVASAETPRVIFYNSTSAFGNAIFSSAGGVLNFTTGANPGTTSGTIQLSISTTGVTTSGTLGIGGSGVLAFSAAASKVIPGATSFSLRNNADSADNMVITNAGAVTFRSTVGGITTLTATTVVANLTGNVTGNASTATTLQTTRTIWGQNFNGSASVTGALSSVTDIGMSGILSGYTNIQSSIGDFQPIAFGNSVAWTSNLRYSGANDPSVAANWTYITAATANNNTGLLVKLKANTSEGATEFAIYTTPVSTGAGAVPASLTKRFGVNGFGIVDIPGSLNVTGDTTAGNFVGPLTGNADTATSATQLTNTRTIWGQNFNGLANVSGAMTGVTTISMSGALTMTAAASQIIPGATSWAVRNNANSANNIIITDAGAVTFRSTVNGITTLTATSLVGALTGNASTATTLQTTRTIWGQNFNGSANVSGALSGATSLDLSGTITSTVSGNILRRTGTSTVQQYIQIGNTGNDFYVGIESSVAGSFFTGSSAYAGVMYSNGGNVELIVSGVKRVAATNTGVAITGKLFLDGGVGSDTYIWENSGNSIQFVAGGVNHGSLGGNAFIIPPTNRFYLDGGGDTYIYESSANHIDVVTGNNLNMRFHAGGDASLQSGKALYLDGGSDTYIYESSANVFGFVNGGVTRFEIGGQIVMHGDAEIFAMVARTASQPVYMSFYNSAGTRRGYFGFGAGSSTNLYITNDEGPFIFQPNGGGEKFQINSSAAISQVNITAPDFILA